MITQLILAAFGGLCIDLLKFLELKAIPPKDFMFWLKFCVRPLLGVGLVFAYIQSNVVISPILALNIGVSAPLILRSFAQAVPSTSINPGTDA